MKVVCGIIYNENKIFICKRSPHKSLSGYWEFPGGKIEPDETPETSLSRELLEELGMNVIIHAHFKTVIHHYDTFTIQLMAYTCQFLDATYHLTDHDEYAWVTKEELQNYPLAPADIPIAQTL